MAIWNTSISDLLFNFQGALKSLTPWMESSMIPYSERDGYDDWDNISDSLYKAIVINSIIYSQGFESRNQFADYNTHYSSYKGLNFIVLEKKSDSDKEGHYLVFNSFSGSTHFDKVDFSKVDRVTLEATKREQRVFDRDDLFLVINGKAAFGEKIIVNV